MLSKGGRPVYAEKIDLSFSQKSYETTSTVSNAMCNMVSSSKSFQPAVVIQSAIHWDSGGPGDILPVMATRCHSHYL